MKSFFKGIRRLSFHFLAMLAIGIVALFFVFFYYLPHTTKHGKSVVVPSLLDLRLPEAADLLHSVQLGYRVAPDSAYNPHKPPHTVFKQFPVAGSRVKENREIRLTLNAQTPPLVRMPKLINGSLTNALLLLEARQLKLGRISYVRDLAENAVLQQQHEGEAIAPQSCIARGSVIDLMVGGGLGGTKHPMPKVVGFRQKRAREVLEGLGLVVSTIHTTDELRTAKELSTGRNLYFVWEEIQHRVCVVYDQLPKENRRVKKGDYVELWVYEPSAAAATSSRRVAE